MNRVTLIRGVVGGALVVAGTAGVIFATHRAGRQHDRLSGAKPSTAAQKAIETKMRKLQARRDKLTAEYREAMKPLWSGDITPEAWAKVKTAYEAQDDALDDAINVLDWQRRGAKPPKDVMARVKPELLKGIETDWWKRQPQPRRCFRTKTAALREFRDANQDTIGHWGGMDVKSSRGEFDAINTRYIRRLRGKPAITIAQAFWAALPPGPPYCLDDLDLHALNETSPGQHGRGFRLPTWMEEDRSRRAEERYYASQR